MQCAVLGARKFEKGCFEDYVSFGLIYKAGVFAFHETNNTRMHSISVGDLIWAKNRIHLGNSLESLCVGSFNRM